jgi:hypothetical protein
MVKIGRSMSILVKPRRSRIGEIRGCNQERDLPTDRRDGCLSGAEEIAILIGALPRLGTIDWE